jgi:two-component system sensor histidine kinase/response regulator
MMSANANPGVSVDVPSDDPLADDLELRQELAAMFLEDSPRLLSEIRDAMNQHDGPALKFAAHTLKGSAGVFRVQPAFEAALRMEHVGRDSDWNHAEEAWINVNKEMSGLSAMLREPTGSPAAQERL